VGPLRKCTLGGGERQLAIDFGQTHRRQDYSGFDKGKCFLAGFGRWRTGSNAALQHKGLIISFTLESQVVPIPECGIVAATILVRLSGNRAIPESWMW